jgi:putative membrane protein
LRGSAWARWRSPFERALFGLFLLQLLLVGFRLFEPSAIFGEARWPDGVLLLLATAVAVVSAARQLPAQNVMLASVIILFIAGLAHSVGALTGIPFGPYIYTDQIGPQLFRPLPWAIPVLWVLLLFTCRGVGRLILRPWRKTRNYGFWLMGITCGLVVIFDLGLEPFATQAKKLWLWHPTKALVYWYRTPWINFLGWAATTLVILAFATPSLINKKPVKQPPDYSPLAMWLLLNGLFVAAMAAHRLWLGLGVVSCASVAVAVFAIKGAKW